jgi:hypothetical protein
MEPRSGGSIVGRSSARLPSAAASATTLLAVIDDLDRQRADRARHRPRRVRATRAEHCAARCDRDDDLRRATRAQVVPRSEDKAVRVVDRR